MALSTFIPALATQVPFSLNDSEADATDFGYGTAETYSVAILLNQPGMLGKDVVSVSVTLPKGVTDCSAWLSKKLNTKTVGGVKVNNPDLCTVAGEVSDGKLTVTFPEGTTVPESGVYIGYSFTVPEVKARYEKPVAIVPHTGPNTLWIQATESQTRWSDLSKLGNTKDMGSAMEVTFSGDFELGATASLAKNTYTARGDQSDVDFTIVCQGPEAVESVAYEYEIEGRTGEGEVTLHMPLSVLGRSTTATAKLTGLGDLAQGTLKLSITQVNGKENPYAEAASSTLKVLPFHPVNRPLVEEYTALHCGWCVRGYVLLEQMKEEHGDRFVAISYHFPTMEDGCMVSAESYSFPKVPGSLPNADFDRQGLTKVDVLRSMWNNDIDALAPCDISLDYSWVDDTRTQLRADASCRFLEGKENARYKYGFVMVADGLSNPEWVQTNAYADQEAEGIYTGPYWDLFVGQDSHLSGLVYNDVAVYLPDCRGITGSLPSSIAPEQKYDYTYIIDADKVVNVKGENIVGDFSKTRIIAFVLDAASGHILNCISSGYVADTPSAISQNVADTVTTTEYYDIMGRQLLRPSGICIRVDRLADGSSRVAKILAD